MSTTAVQAAAQTFERLRGSRLSARVKSDADLRGRTTYRVGGRARVLIEVHDVSDLEELAQVTSETGVDILVIGRGSNLLIADSGFEGLVVVLGRPLAEVAVTGTVAGAGGAALLPVVARTTARAGLTGFEWAVGVPGAIGGAVRMNAGGHGSDMAASLRHVDVVDLAAATTTRRSVEDLHLGYRRSDIGPSEVVFHAELALAADDPQACRTRIDEVVRWRRQNQPGGQNAGSVFTNPEGDSAGRLIESVGGKGLRIGTAEVSPKHANFIQSDDDGSAADVLAVMIEVRRRVRDAHGITLRPETRLVGFEPDQLTELHEEERQ